MMNATPEEVDQISEVSESEPSAHAYLNFNILDKVSVKTGTKFPSNHAKRVGLTLVWIVLALSIPGIFIIGIQQLASAWLILGAMLMVAVLLGALILVPLSTRSSSGAPLNDSPGNNNN
jgi:Zn-dependent membrane protease YugP